MAKWKNVSDWSGLSGKQMNGRLAEGTDGYRRDGTLLQTGYRTVRGSGWPEGEKLTNGIPIGFSVRNTFAGYSFFDDNPVAVSRCWRAFIDAIRGPRSMLGITFAQWERNLNMITARSLQIVSFVRRLLGKKPAPRKFRSYRTKGGLVITRRRQQRNKKSGKQVAADAWLEASYGWKPLMTDIYHAARSLGGEFPTDRIRARGFEMRRGPFLKATQNGVRFEVPCVVRMGALATIDNPNAYYLQQLGLANPALVAWDLIPFSFVVNWFTDVETFLGSFTDLLGVRLTESWSTCTLQGRAEFLAYDRMAQPPSYRIVRGNFFSHRRQAGIVKPVPNLRVLGNLGKSLTRATNAVALLTTLLASRRA